MARTFKTTLSQICFNNVNNECINVNDIHVGHSRGKTLQAALRTNQFELNLSET